MMNRKDMIKYILKNAKKNDMIIILKRYTK